MDSSSSIEMSATVPKNWTIVLVKSAIGKIPLTEKKLKKKNYAESGLLPVIDQGQKFIGGYTNNDDLRIVCRSPVIVFGDHTKIIKYVDFDFVAGADGVKVIRPLRLFYPKLFYYFLQSIRLPEKGYARHFQFLEKSSIPLPPLPEQHRIVAKIEELFTKLDAGIEALKKIKSQLKRYRQAVLKQAFEGKLTAEWRENHEGKLRPVAEIFMSLKKKWKEKQGKAKMPALSENGISDSLPEGWMFLTLPWLAQKGKNTIKRGPFGSSVKKSFFVPSGYKVYEQKNVIYNDFDRGNYFIDEKKYNDLKSFSVKPGDILISCSGTIGKIAIVPKNAQAGIINQALLKISLDNEIVLSNYFTKLFEFKAKEIVAESTRGSAILNISSVRDLKRIEFPIPQLIEQCVIMSEIERYFSIADEIENTINQSLEQTERLRQSIFKKAFEGKLVSQDPDDEPAEILLERIKAEKEKSAEKIRSKKRINKKAKQRRLL